MKHYLFHISIWLYFCRCQQLKMQRTWHCCSDIRKYTWMANLCAMGIHKQATSLHVNLTAELFYLLLLI